MFLFVFGKPFFLACARKGAKGPYGTVLMLCVLRSWLRLPSFVLSEHVFFRFHGSDRAKLARPRAVANRLARRLQRSDRRSRQREDKTDGIIKLRLMSMVNEND